MLVTKNMIRSFGKLRKHPSTRETGYSVDQFKIGYWQLWLYTWRHFTGLGGGCPRKEDGEDTPMPEEPDPTILALVWSLGEQAWF